MRTINTDSATWHAIVDRAITEIEKCRSALEIDKGKKTTTRLRAKISVLRDVLKWPEDGRDEPVEGINLIP